ncbi:MAG: SHD1 domain-containing protein [Pirellulales bacterium]|nr:SHD1 domain-containing protein [Pirellulales bacterium]
MRHHILAWTVCALLLMGVAHPVSGAETRKWQSHDGKYNVTGELQEFREATGEVLIHKENGKTITVPLSVLSAADQEYVKAQTTQPHDAEHPPAKAATESDEQLAKELVEQFLAAHQPIQQPTWEKIWAEPVSSKPREIVFSQQGDLCAILDEAGNCVVRDLIDGTIVVQGERALVGNVLACAISPDGKLVLTSSLEQPAILWDARSGKQLHLYKTPRAPIKVSLPTADRVVMLFEDGSFSHGPLRQAKLTNILPQFPDGELPADSLAVSPNGLDVLIWKNKGRLAQHYQFPTKAASKAGVRKYRTPQEFEPLTGGLITKHFQALFDLSGRMRWLGTMEASRPGKSRLAWTRYTTLRTHLERGVVSPDERLGAFVSEHGVLAFPAENPALWKMFAPPAFQEKSNLLWLAPDFQRLAMYDSGRLTLYRADLTNQIRDVPLLRKCVENKKFQALNQAYLLLDQSPAYSARSLIQPYTQDYLQLVDDALNYQSEQTNGEFLAEWDNWAAAAEDATLGTVYYAQKAAAAAWAARGGDTAANVKPGDMKKFLDKMAETRKLLLPLMQRKHVPAEAVYQWLRACQALGWEEEDVALGMEKLLKSHPYHADSHRMIMFSLLPRWHGEPGDAQAYSEKVIEAVPPEYQDALYCVMHLSILRQKQMMQPDILFDEIKNPPRVLDNLELEWERLLSGADQLSELLPDDPYGPTLGLYLSIQICDVPKTKHYLKIIDEKFRGIIAQIEYFSYADMYFLREALKAIPD